VGSTEEEEGYRNETTVEAIAELKHFAYALIPPLARAVVERTWSGLRPGSFDGFPYLGSVPGYDNLFVAAGHFRSGLALAPATALVMAQLMCGKTPEINLTPFSVLRH
jgi:glycine oxidase